MKIKKEAKIKGAKKDEPKVDVGMTAEDIEKERQRKLARK